MARPLWLACAVCALFLTTAATGDGSAPGVDVGQDGRCRCPQPPRQAPPLDWDTVVEELLGLTSASAARAVGPQFEQLERKLNASVALHGPELAVNISDSLGDILDGQERLAVGQQQLQHLLADLDQVPSVLDAVQAGQSDVLSGLAEVAELKAGQRRLEEALASLQAALTSSVSADCPKGWHRGGGICYLLPDEAASWFGAQHACARHHPEARLASVHPDTEQYVRAAMDVWSPTRVWIGLSRTGDGDVWGWSDGTPLVLNHSRWRPGEPNDSGNGEDCVELYHDNNLWNDVSCSNALRFLCERRLR